MPIEHLRILTILVIASALAAILSGDLGLPLFLSIIAVNIPLYFDINLEEIRNHFFWKIYGPATIVVIGALFWAGISIKIPIFILVLFCIIYEYYGEKRLKAPPRLIGLLSFLVLLYQARVESGLNLMFGVAIYLFAVLWSLYAFHAAKLYGYGFFKLVRRSFAPILGLTPLISIIGVLIFWMLPRLPDQTLGTIPSLNGNRLSGFDSRVTLSDIGSLKLSRKHVMDLKPLSGQIHTDYLRGQTLNNYANGIWENTVFQPYFPRRQDNEFKLRSTRSPTYEYKIDLEPMFGNNLFFPDTLISIKGIPQSIKVLGATDNITSPSAIPLALSYTVSASEDPLELGRHSKIQSYINLPDAQSYLYDFTNNVVDPQDSVLDKAEAIRAFLQNNYTYSLEINNQGSDDPLFTFLLESRQGHCELFASAMALMCRTQNIPTRIVTGFIIPDVHPSGNFHYITESDAHAWVEVLHNDTWVRFDPTPTTNFSTPGFGEIQLAYLRNFWRSKIMNWSNDDQKALLETGRDIAHTIKVTFLQNTVSMLLALAIVVSLVQILRTNTTNREARLLRLYRSIYRHMEKAKGERPATLGVVSFSRNGPWSQEAQTALDHFLERYQVYRFSKENNSQVLAELIKSGKTARKLMTKKPS